MQCQVESQEPEEGLTQRLEFLVERAVNFREF